MATSTVQGAQTRSLQNGAQRTTSVTSTQSATAKAPSRAAFGPSKETLLIARLAGMDPALFITHRQEPLPSGVLARGIVLFERENCYVNESIGDELLDALEDPLFANACAEASRSFQRLQKNVSGLHDRSTELRDLRRWHQGHFAIRMFRAGFLTAQEQLSGQTQQADQQGGAR